MSLRRSHNGRKLYLISPPTDIINKVLLEQNLPTIILLERVTEGACEEKPSLMEKKVTQTWPITSACKINKICPVYLQLLPFDSIPATLTYLLFLKHRKLTSHSGPFHVLFPLLGTAFPRYTCVLPLFPSCLYLKAAFSKGPALATLSTFSTDPSPLTVLQPCYLIL